MLVFWNCLHATLVTRLIILASSSMLVTSASYRSFTLAQVSSRGPVRSDQSWLALSTISCAARCMENYANCRSFMFNPSSRLCTPCSLFKPKQLLPTADEGHLYHSLHCEQRGFWTYIREDTEACLHQYKPDNYTNAKAHCRSMGGYLMSLKSRDKFVILMEANYAQRVWVGLDDIDEKGIFTWVEDGQALSDDDKQDLFGKDPPSSGCGTYFGSDVYLSSTNCSIEQTYMCEINLPD